MEIAKRAGIPLLFVASIRSPAVVAELARLRPDAIAVACFPGRLPPSLLDLPPLGALNVHPSLLPRDRGPSPLFWAFHRGDDATGVTVHLMEETLDTGPIVRQWAVAIAEGRRLSDLEFELATLGGQLLVDALLARASGDLARPRRTPPWQPRPRSRPPRTRSSTRRRGPPGGRSGSCEGFEPQPFASQTVISCRVVDAARLNPPMTPGASVADEQNRLT
jgi:methionyl-tRNA formyltransferase